MKDIYIKLCLLIIFQPKNDKKEQKQGQEIPKRNKSHLHKIMLWYK